MLRQEAEREAAQRNLEDPDRERFEFYAFDQSAGLAEDAWEVATRLRRAPVPEPPPPPAEPPPPETAAATARVQPALDYVEPPPAAEAQPYPVAEPVDEPPPAQPAPAEPAPQRARRPRPPLPRLPRRARPAAGPGLEDELTTGPERAGRFVRTVGAVVMVAGMLWMAMVVALAALLSPDDAQELALYIGFGVLGLLAILLGVAIRRS
jgi:hypothetical protein